MPEIENRLATDDCPHAWQREGLFINAFGRHLRRRFGGRVQRVSVDAGFTCPNVDGAVTTGGCNFCDNRSFSPSRRVRLRRVSEQLSAGIERVTKRYDRVEGFIAYFQPATNTYAPVEQLEEIFQLALAADSRIVGLAVGTRPDCVPESVLELLERLAVDHSVSLEFGMQSVHDESLQWMNRAHTHADMINAIDRARGRGFECCAHVILGVPGEDHAMMMQTAHEVGVLGLDAIKLHNLYSVHGTPLGDEVLAGKVQMMDREEYIRTVVDFLELIPPTTIVERVSGDAPPQFLIEPKWCLEKSAIRNEIDAEFARRRSRQGARFVAPPTPPLERPRPSDQTPDSIAAQIDQRGRLPVLKMQGS
ncbi:TIGR01212 family radical SAM protein [Allorhodopirellula solitaria]|uniref:Oxygen-independent coproporphyrinogen-III oxidase 1 n=1 Tax=Allorhodopirellula solitaria TaxID=2527987 RepID=A0A5C5WQ08_9BACT|nr:TIGR01212 family radical SAM protein [Allorhodopirellula solitaria]TWT52113.1 Oxygen-independent coproporphyrinogen-III oxidase 1 [Allorhodopirellula solitaria]